MSAWVAEVDVVSPGLYGDLIHHILPEDFGNGFAGARYGPNGAQWCAQIQF